MDDDEIETDPLDDEENEEYDGTHDWVVRMIRDACPQWIRDLSDEDKKKYAIFATLMADTSLGMDRLEALLDTPPPPFDFNKRPSERTRRILWEVRRVELRCARACRGPWDERVAVVRCDPLLRAPRSAGAKLRVRAS
jgi:hypothetical protein